LLVCLGEATRMSDDLMRGVKWYLARIRFGIRTATDDATGQVLEQRLPAFLVTDLEAALRRRIGNIQQVPPAFAAIKQQGRPAYKAARAGEVVELAPRAVAVHAIALLSVHGGRAETATGASPVQSADLLISCSKGTYIRSIARDVGEDLGCGGHLSGLRRLASGSISSLNCAAVPTLEEAVAAGGPAALASRLLPLDLAVSDRPACLLGGALESLVRAGRQVAVPVAHPFSDLRLYGASGELTAMAAPAGGHLYHPHRVFAPAGGA
ncbi:MAG: tRNA pseudouridine(55) synthase TruB, partial [Chloroflexota bacterium]